MFPSAMRLPLQTAMADALRTPGAPGPRVVRAQAFALPRVLDRYEALFDEIASST